jgi:hypothetical protein
MIARITCRRKPVDAGMLVLARIALPLLVLAATGTAAAADRAETQACVEASEKGQSLRDEEKYRAAREAFIQCSRDVCPAVVVKSCANWLRELDQTVPTIVLAARDDQGKDIADVTVTFDGKPLATRLDGKPLEVDGGEHALHFEHAGSLPVDERVIVRAGEKTRIVMVTMKSAAATDVTTTPPAPEPDAPPPPERLASPRHVTAAVLVLGALGAAGAGVFFTTQASSEMQTASTDRGSRPTNACAGVASPSCSSLNSAVQSQHSDTNVATGLFVGAGALAAGAVLTWFVWPRPSSSAPGEVSAPPPTASLSLAPLLGGAAFSLRGSFE